jgi:hypothetical protein
MPQKKKSNLLPHLCYRARCKDAHTEDQNSHDQDERDLGRNLFLSCILDEEPHRQSEQRADEGHASLHAHRASRTFPNDLNRLCSHSGLM